MRVIDRHQPGRAFVGAHWPRIESQLANFFTASCPQVSQVHNMGLQTQLHMLSDDCKELMDFIQQRDPVLVVDWSAESREVSVIKSPWSRGGFYCLWNQALLPVLDREYIHRGGDHPYYRVRDELPVVELSYPDPVATTWNGRLALTQGRLYTGINPHKGKDFEKWYAALVRWVRKHFIKNPIPHLGGFVGPAAYEWYRKGGLLLPIFTPPLSPQWISWMEAQDQHRATFSAGCSGL